MNDADADKIDAYLGNGTFYKWDELDGSGRGALARAKRLDKMLWAYDHSLSVLSPYGTGWVEKIKNDLDSGFDSILKGKFVDPGQFRPLFEIYGPAIDTAELQMDEAEAIGMAGFINGVASLRSLGLSIEVKRLHEDLMELDTLLREAQSELIEVEIKAALGYVITTVELMLPGLGLLAKGGLTAAEIAMEGGKGTAAGTKYAKIGLEAVETIEKVAHAVRHVAQRGAKALTITGFYFDAEEVLHASKRVKKIKELLERANKEYGEVSERLGAALKALKRWVDHMNGLLRPIRSEIYDKQRVRDALITRHSYSLITPVAWRIVADQDKDPALRLGRR